MTCPALTKKQCKLWEYAVIGIVLVISIAAVTMRFDDWSIFRQAITGLAVTGCIFWSIWILRAFYSIVTWWADMHSQLANITTLLAETKSDIKEIKLISDHSHLK